MSELNDDAGVRVFGDPDQLRPSLNEALAASQAVTAQIQKKHSSASVAIHKFEQSLVDAFKLVRLAHSAVSRTFEGDGGGAHPSLALIEISLRALNQANDAARYARHVLTGKVQAHHGDYSKPLDVKWFCSLCHGRASRKNEPEQRCRAFVALHEGIK